MDYNDIQTKSLQEVFAGAIDDVKHTQHLGSQYQTIALIAVMTRCTMELTSTVNNASRQIEATAARIHDFDESTTVLTKQVIRLNKILTVATVVIAAATVLATAAAILALYKAGSH